MGKGKTLADREFALFVWEPPAGGRKREVHGRAWRLRLWRASTMSRSSSVSIASLRRLVLVAAILLVGGSTARAQTPDAAAPAPLPAEIELNLINLPTTRSLPKHGSYFRLTHRFARDLRRGDLGQLAEDLFSLDNGAIIGLEYRFGITSDLQAGIHRSILSRTIEMFGRYDRWRQSDSLPVSISLLGAVEGLDNFSEHFQPTIAATVSRVVGGGRLVVYGVPMYVAHTAAADFLTGHDEHDHGVGGADDEHSGHDDTFMLGLGGRVRLRPSVYVAAEASPRLAGHDPGRATWGFALEKKTEGHTLQINFTNSFGTTFGQLARVGSEHDLYLGFNITRRF
jgi:hypothetical protein